MVLAVPNLDDVDFDRLTEEARALIPRFAPEWTDHNVHDPGITLLELVAWLVDQQIYQIGYLGPSYRAAWAALLGQRPQPARAAKGLVWPHNGALDFDCGTRDLLAGNVARAVKHPRLGFQLTHDLHLTEAKLTSWRVIDRPGGPYAARHSSHLRTSVPLPGSGPFEIELNLDRPLVERGPLKPQKEGRIAIGIELEEDFVSADLSEAELTRFSKYAGRLEVRYGIGTGPLKTLSPDRWEDQTLVLHRTGVMLVTLPPPSWDEVDADPDRDADAQAGADEGVTGKCVNADGATEIDGNSGAQSGGNLDVDEHGSRLRIKVLSRLHPRSARIRVFALNVLPVVQQEERLSLALGTSNGLPDQRFDMPLSGVREEDQKTLIRVAPPPVHGHAETRVEIWRAEPDLQTLGPENACRLDEANGQVIFGNGVNGRIPPAEAQVFFASHAWTAGAAGNLSAREAWTVANVLLAEGHTTFGTNRAPITGGEDAWDTERTVREAILASRRRVAASTNAELEYAARGARGFGVARAAVFPGVDIITGQEDVATRSVVLIPEREAGLSPCDERRLAYVNVFSRTIAEVLEDHRLVGERLVVCGFQPVEIGLRARLRIDPNVDREAVHVEAEARLRARLTDVHPHGALDDEARNAIDPWPPGRPVSAYELQTLLLSIEGLEVVEILALDVLRVCVAEGDAVGEVGRAGDAQNPTLHLQPYQVAILSDVEFE